MNTRAELLVIVLLLAGAARAGEVYKCKGPRGEVTFTNIKCPENAAAEHYGTFQNVPDDVASAPAQDATVIPNAPAPRVRAADQPTIVGFACEANGHTWLQTAECPKTTTVDKPVDIIGSDAGASASITVRTPVEATPLDHDAFCARLKNDPDVAIDQRSTPAQGYQRNRMRTKVGC